MCITCIAIKNMELAVESIELMTQKTAAAAVLLVDYPDGTFVMLGTDEMSPADQILMTASFLRRLESKHGLTVRQIVEELEASKDSPIKPDPSKQFK